MNMGIIKVTGNLLGGWGALPRERAKVFCYGVSFLAHKVKFKWSTNSLRVIPYAVASASRISHTLAAPHRLPHSLQGPLEVGVVVLLVI
jgi:hypothetical protein